jgi:hypothetical protein
MLNITNDIVKNCGIKENKTKNNPQSPLGKGGYRGLILKSNSDYLLHIMFILKNGGPNAC